MHALGILIDQILKIVSDPASNLTGAVLLLAMVVLVLLILAIAALITILPGAGDEDEDEAEVEGAKHHEYFVPGEEDEEVVPPSAVPDGRPPEEAGEDAHVVPDESAEDRKPRRRQPFANRAGLMLLPALLVLAGTVWGWQVTGDPARCASCHATAPYATSWASGDHARTTCVACHEDGGIGVVPAAVQRVSNAAAGVAGENAATARVPVPAYRCLRCHADVARLVLTVGAVKVSHKEFLSKGYECARCHLGVGHSPGGAPQRAVPMGECVSCHDGHTAGDACSTCHVGDPSAAVRVDRAVFPKVDISPPPGCTGCHETKTCFACHGIVMPHPAGFETGKGHARLAVFEGKQKVCYRCHIPQDCAKCHTGDFNNHGAGWKKDHPSGMPLDGRNTCACHNTPNFCGLCHATSKK